MKVEDKWLFLMGVVGLGLLFMLALVFAWGDVLQAMAEERRRKEDKDKHD